MKNKEINSLNELSEKAVKKESKRGNQNTEEQRFQGSNESVNVEKETKESKVTEYSENTKECCEKASENLSNNCDISLNGAKTCSLTEEKNPKDAELDRLLRLANSNIWSARNDCTEQKEMKPQEKKITKAVPQSKEPEMSLADCFDSQGNDEERDKLITSQVTSEDDFVKQFNSEARNFFLFSSESSASEWEKEETRLDDLNEKNVSKPSRNTVPNDERKGNDLREYRISLSENESRVNSSEKEIEKLKTSEKKQLENDDNYIALDSLDSAGVVFEVSDSDSEIIQIDEVPRKRIPVKGRRKINKIFDDENLEEKTKLALKKEKERKRRVEDRQKLMECLYGDADERSKLVLDFDPDTREELVVVDDNLSKHLKPHQREGVKFMWNCCFESLDRIKEEEGSGCVLAHCMGLGKSLQVIAVIHSVLSHSHLRTVLIMCPLITVKNWFNEFKIWTTDCRKPIKPFDIGTSSNKSLDQIIEWMERGGVLIISYEMFRSLVKRNRYSHYWRFLLDSGPDVVVCDEGHLMKNPSSGLSKCVTRIRTSRRIILTGTPLQNNLMEYYSMVQFVKPNLLGTTKEFRNRFVNPITNGQFENSTQNDVFVMKQRSHVLHSLLQSFVQRLGYDVLEPLLPTKQEFVIFVALTEIQEKMYVLSLKKPLKNGRGLLWDFHWFHKIWTHPVVVRSYFDKNHIEKHLREAWEKLVPDEDYQNLKSSNKLTLFFSILRKCRQIGDKVLVFSQSLYTLGLIENFLLKLNYDYASGRRSEFTDTWVLNQDYLKLTGSTKSEEREKYHQIFSTSKRACLFLISTRVGGLGINLAAANRVVLFDASWNPAHDLQSIFRVYRFGQKKPCYIYRFLAAATMEEKIYKRQITKLSLAHRILDEHQIERHYSSQNLLELYTYNPPPPRSEWKVPKIPKDQVLAEVLSNNRDLIVSYHEHNSLLENKEEEELTEEERQAAWENYEREKASSRKFKPYVQRPSRSINDGCGTNSVKLSDSDERQFIPESGDGRGSLDVNNLLELGSSFGLKPYEEEATETYLKRVERALKIIFPWGAPRVIIQGDVLQEV